MFHQELFFVMALITKLFRKDKVFEWTAKCQTTWEDIKNQYIQALILINPNYELKLHILLMHLN
jgi:hypothetical protein